MQSKNYVSGVSGWKLHLGSGRLEVSGVICDGGLDRSTPEPKTFIIVDGVTYMNEAFIKDGMIGDKHTIESQFLVDSAKWAVKMERRQDGRLYCAGIGVGVGDAVIATEASARASADEAISSRIGALETRIGSLALEALAIKGAIDAAAALNRK
jgi:hypothetical protein